MTTATPNADSALARVGSAVADRRADLGLTQRQLAEKAGVGLNTAALLERGQTFPQARNARKLEEALEWPRGALSAIRRGEKPPSAEHVQLASPSTVQQVGQGSGAAPTVTRAAPGLSTVVAAEPGGGSAQALAIATGVVGVAATCMDILVRRAPTDPATVEALRELEAQLLRLETLIAASLPHADSFDDTMSALAELHRHRDAIRHAAAQAG
ncbi:helix-turn-helix domain-containing protein [Mycobacterium kansasii]